MYSIVTLICKLLAAAQVASALGQATIVNHCSFPIYVWSVSNIQGPMQTIDATTGQYQETYQINPAGGGISLKISKEPTLSTKITQLEYTLLDDQLWYDVSNVNGSPFRRHGLSMIPSISTCRSVKCRPGSLCGTQVYQEPNDNFAIGECSPDGNLVMTICTGNPSPGSPRPRSSRQPTSIPPTFTTVSLPPVPSTTATSPPQTAAPVVTTPINHDYPPQVHTITTYLTTVVTVDHPTTITDTFTATPT